MTWPFSVGQEFESCLAGQFWCGGSGLVAVRCRLGLQSSGGWAGAGGPAPRQFTPMAHRWHFSHSLSAGLLECPHNMAASPRVNGPEGEWARQQLCLFYDLALEVTQRHLGSILFVTQVSPVCWRLWIPGGRIFGRYHRLPTPPSYFCDLPLLNWSPIAGHLDCFHCFAIVWNVCSWKALGVWYYFI